MKLLLVALTVCGAARFTAAAPSVTNQWNYASNVENTSPWKAAEWFESENWQHDGVPDGKDWYVKFDKAPRPSYIRIGRPLTLGYLSVSTLGSDVTLISDSPLTIDSTANYNISGGKIFADIQAGAGQNEGVAGMTEINGRVSFPGLFYLANQYALHRLDHYAVSPNSVRTDDFLVAGIYRGSGNYIAVGPRKGVAHYGEWTVTAGSPFVTRAGSAPAVAAGQTVACGDVFPEGTFVRRIYSDTEIELSHPASASAGSGVKTLSFAAYDPVTRFVIPELRMVSKNASYTSFVQYDEDGDFRVEVLKLTASSGTNGQIPFRPSAGYISGTRPARVVIHDAAPDTNGYGRYADKLIFMMGDCHIEFAETGREGARSGIPAGTATTFSGGVTRLSVTNGIDASIALVTNFTNTIVKDGAGSLELGLTNDVTRNTGTLVVKEGEMVLPAGSWVKTLAVSNGATLRISGMFSPGNFIAEAGARIAGDGVLSLSDVSSARGVIFAEGACLQVPGVSQLRTEAPATNVPSSVAFWVDASRFDTITCNNDDGTNVLRITDVRGEAYGFATNTAGGFPQLVRDHRDRPHHLNLPWVDTAKAQTDPAKCITLIWDRPYTNILAVFQVLDTRDGGGQFLGRTDRVSRQDYMRNAEWGRLFQQPIFNNTGDATERVRSGRFYVNGRRGNPDDGYPYPGGGASRKLEDGTDVRWCVPAVFSVHPASDTHADAFGFNSAAGSRSGYHRVCECLIFTNEVTETERLAITGYLMKKWLNHEVSWTMTDGDPFPAVDPAAVGGISVAEGEVVSVGEITGPEMFVKKGAGTLFVEDYAAPDGSLDVASGTLTVNSRLPSRDEVPDGAYVHFDASDTNTLTVKSSGMVSAWRDVRGQEYLTATAHANTTAEWATVTHDTPLPGMSAVDFGEYRGFAVDGSMVDRRMSSSLWYPACSELHTVFMVMDSSKGGGVLVGSAQDLRPEWEGSYVLSAPNAGYGLRRFEVPGQLTYSMPILTNASWNGQKCLLYEGGSRARLNGQKINPLTTGFSGGWDVVSLVSYEDFGGGSFASIAYNRYVGGQAVGEAILFREGLSERQVDKVEAYLSWKWFGRTTPGFRPAAVSNLTVRAGATLSLTGGQPLSVNGAFSCGGAVEGALAFGSGAVIVVTVGQDGTVSPARISGAVDFSAGGTVLVTGALSTLAPGEYRIVSSSSASVGAAGFEIVLDGDLRRNLSSSVRTDDAGLVLSVKAPGMMIIVK